MDYYWNGLLIKYPCPKCFDTGMDYLSPFKANKRDILVKIKLPNWTQRLFACSDLLSPKDA